MTRSVLVAGGAGFIGSTTSRHLARAGYRPVILDDFSRGHRRFVSDLTVHEGDIADVETVRRVLEHEQITAVLHFAARIEVGESVKDPLGYYKTNVAGTVALLEAMRQAGVTKLVFSSSAAVYGTPRQVPIAEDHPVAPVNPYGHTKAMMEQIIADCGAAPAEADHAPLSWIALRYFNAAGADTSLDCGEWHQPESHLIPNALRAVAGLQDELSLFGTDHPTPDGSAVRDYIHVVDLAAAHVAAVNKLLAEQRVARAYNLGNGAGYSVREVIDTVSKVTGKPVPHRECPIRPGDPPTLVAAAEAARAELGWSPRFPELETIVGDAWEWFNTHGFEPR